jgi:UDP-N-acetyl-D-glucosamine dehydrogenase
MTTLADRIARRQAQVVIVGAGYVGLPLAVEVARAGFPTLALERDPERVRSIAAGRSYVRDVPGTTIAALTSEGRLRATSDPAELGRADVVIVCVPTPLNKTRDPDNSFIAAAADQIALHLRAPQLIVLESTTFPGFTREILLPKLAATGSRLDTDFFVAFSPERADPGNTRFTTRNTPKVIGASSPASLALATALYGTFVERVVPVSSTDAAEMVKLLENTFRAVNIGLVNEVAMMCDRLGLDTWEIIEAAATKPFGFMPFYPGPGLGGHCIPVDPRYLSWKLKTLRYRTRFIELADEVNSEMPAIVVMRVSDALNERRQTLNGARILVAGVAYKRDVDDVRESPAFEVMSLLRTRGARVDFTDPHVPRLEVEGAALASVPVARAGEYDCVVIVTDHGAVDYAGLVDVARLVVDCRNVTGALRGRHPGRIVPL